MSPPRHLRCFSHAIAMVVALALGSAAAQTVIFSDSFTGTGGLNGTTPDVTTGGANWVSGSTFSADGSFAAAGGSIGSSATLSFTPSSGFIYTLEARADVGSSGWIGLGFADGQSTGVNGNSRFVNGSTPLGRVWMLHLNGAAGRASQNGTAGHHETWTAVDNVTGNIDMRIVLDTQVPGAWKARWYAKDATATDFTQVWQTEDVISANINSVGFAVPGANATGTISSFLLSVEGGVPDATPPDLIALNPEHDASEVPVNASLSATFNEMIRAGSGNITLRRADGSDVEVFDVATSASVSIIGSTLVFTPSADLDPATSYYVLIDATAIEDLAGNPFAGLLDSTDWNFTTSPLPADDPLVAFIPVTDGNPLTDENGYAGSAINSFAYAQDNLITIGDQQFISYYRRHATDSNHPDNNTVLIARRNLGETVWEIFPTNFTSVNINDTHNVISMAIDGDGVLHMAWGVHGHALRYAKSNVPVLGADPIIMTRLDTAGMTGQEKAVTYPKFQTLPDGDIVFLYREGGSGNGDWFLHRYDIDTATWSPVHADGNGNTRPLFQGRGQTPNNCFYPDRLTLGPDGLLHISGVFRYNSGSPTGRSGYQTNHRYVYLRSPDGGTTWQRSDGSTINLPAVNNASFLNLGASHVPEIVEDIPEGMSLMNQSGMTTDSAGRPVIANWWAADALSGDHTRQYHIFFHDGTVWHRRTVSARDIDNPTFSIPENQLRNHRMGRPLVITDADDRIIVIYNDNRFDGITVVFSLPLAQDPDRNHWTRMNLTDENLGIWEATYDEELWKREGVLQMLYQKIPGIGMDYSAQNNSTPVSVAEWDAHAYFNEPVRWMVDMESTPSEATVFARTRTGFRYDLRTSTDLDFSAPAAATLPGDGNWWDLGTWQMDEPRRFWQIQRTEEATDEL